MCYFRPLPVYKRLKSKQEDKDNKMGTSIQWHFKQIGGARWHFEMHHDDGTGNP